jgi:hypothetical protein
VKKLALFALFALLVPVAALAQASPPIIRAPTLPGHAANKAYVDTGLATKVPLAPSNGAYYFQRNGVWTAFGGPLTDAPSDGQVYGRSGGAWAAIGSGGSGSVTNSSVLAALGYTPVNKAGDTLTGPLAVPTQPASDSSTNAANTKFVTDALSLKYGNSDEDRLRACGWKGDGTNATVASKYSTLSAAQAALPSVLSLTEYLDGACVERVLQLNVRYYGRASIKIPSGGTWVSRTIDTTGWSVHIEGSGMENSMLVLRTPGIALIKHGSRTATPGTQTDLPFELSNISLRCEASNCTNNGTVGIDIAYTTTVGDLWQTSLHHFQIRSFGVPLRIQNPMRGTYIHDFFIFGPDGVIQQNAGIEMTTDRPHSDGPSGNVTIDRGHIANFRFGIFVDMLPDQDTDPSNTTKDYHRSIEGVKISRVTSQNGWGFLFARSRSDTPDYRSVLWEITDCDWQGSGWGIFMQKLGKVKIDGGYWVTNETNGLAHNNPNYSSGLPPGDTAFPITDSSGEIRLMDFRSVDDAVITNIRMDVGGNLGTDVASSHTLIHTDIGCQWFRITNNLFRDQSTHTNGLIRLQSGLQNNAMMERSNTFTWSPNTPRSVWVADPSFNMNSQVNADTAGGTVDETGRYNFMGDVVVTTNASGNATINFPVRATGHPFFLNGAPFVVASMRSFGVTSVPVISSPTAYGFTLALGSSFANTTVQVSWSALGK